MYSGISKTPIWTSQYVTREKTTSNPRKKINFHYEKRILKAHQSNNFINYHRMSFIKYGYRNDNKYSFWQLASTFDMSNNFSIYESHSLANVTPVHTLSNINNIEKNLRDIVTQNNLDIYVISGNIFNEKKLMKIDNGIVIPNKLFKAIYIPKLKLGSAYLFTNDLNQKVEVISLCSLEEITRINFLPTIDSIDKKIVYNLPIKKYKDISTLKSVLKIDEKSKCFEKITTQEIKKNKKLFEKNIICYGKLCNEEHLNYEFEDLNYIYNEKYLTYHCSHSSCLDGEDIICNNEECITLKSRKVIKIKSCIESGIPLNDLLKSPLGDGRFYNLTCYDRNDHIIYAIDID